MLIIQRLSILLVAFTLVACFSMPTGPSVMTLPGSGKSFDQFRFDDYECKQFAHGQVGGTTPSKASMTSGIESAALVTALGAAAGAIFGGGRGAAIGAGSGLLVGGLAGTGSARASGSTSQERYDMSYIQCMYAKGHHVPVSGQITNSVPANNRSENSTPSTEFMPPPPAGNPPPPPPQ